MGNNSRKLTLKWGKFLVLTTVFTTWVSMCDSEMAPPDPRKNEIDARIGLEKNQDDNPVLFSAIGKNPVSKSERYWKRVRPEVTVLNVGKGFKPTIGYFVAPRDGIYLFNSAVLNNNMSNVQDRFLTMTHLTHADWDSKISFGFSQPVLATGHTIVEMKRRDVLEFYGRVDNQLYYSQHEMYEKNEFWRFTGRLIAESEDTDAVVFSVGGIPALASPAEEWSLMSFEKVFLNIGGGMDNNNTGTFVAPVSGVYHFLLQFLANNAGADVRLEKGGLDLSGAFVGDYDHITMEFGAITELAKGFRPEMAVMNVGHGLKPSIGYFVAPRAGIYLFNFVGLIHDLEIHLRARWVKLQHLGEILKDSILRWNLKDPMTLAGHNMVEIKKDDVVEYFGRIDSSTPDYFKSLGFLHNNWWRLSGRLIADPNDLDAVAFCAADILTNSISSPREWINVPFMNVWWNLGEGFHKKDGTFIAPKSGLYHFFLHFDGLGGPQGEMRIEKKDMVLATAVMGKFDRHTIEIDAITKLDQGESVFVRAFGGISTQPQGLKFSGFRV
ncbi:unnamed protein product [Notodromas monacha]|uniref:C1q domain-containing protein n=1 Tax=Notodromas monacha TaxID=399045 RepID=A0A7R9BMA0_9CRUS|nr:unnamed protein product [Notodromas monacha]CAG0917216.1 unnamed protein product [Notodromas monacha]